MKLFNQFHAYILVYPLLRTIFSASQPNRKKIYDNNYIHYMKYIWSLWIYIYIYALIKYNNNSRIGWIRAVAWSFSWEETACSRCIFSFGYFYIFFTLWSLWWNNACQHLKINIISCYIYIYIINNHCIRVQE